MDKTALINPTFFAFKIRIPMNALCCENFGRFLSPKEIQELQICKKQICLSINNSRLKPKILADMIVKHHLIIAFYI